MLICVWLFCGVCNLAWAETQPPEITQLQVERIADAVQLSAQVKFDLPPVVEDALRKGIAVIFVAEADVFRERWYWYNKRVAGVERHMRLSFQPLTQRWRLTIAPGMIATVGLGLALNQNFDTLGDAMATISRFSRWNIANTSELESDQKYLVEFRFRLDAAQLPRPLQIGTLGETDWNIAAVARQSLPTEASK